MRGAADRGAQPEAPWLSRERPWRRRDGARRARSLSPHADAAAAAAAAAPPADRLLLPRRCPRAPRPAGAAGRGRGRRCGPPQDGYRAATERRRRRRARSTSCLPAAVSSTASHIHLPARWPSSLERVLNSAESHTQPRKFSSYPLALPSTPWPKSHTERRPRSGSSVATREAARAASEGGGGWALGRFSPAVCTLSTRCGNKSTWRNVVVLGLLVRPPARHHGRGHRGVPGASRRTPPTPSFHRRGAIFAHRITCGRHRSTCANMPKSPLPLFSPNRSSSSSSWPPPSSSTRRAAANWLCCARAAALDDPLGRAPRSQLVRGLSTKCFFFFFPEQVTDFAGGTNFVVLAILSTCIGGLYQSSTRQIVVRPADALAWGACRLTLDARVWRLARARKTERFY